MHFRLLFLLLILIRPALAQRVVLPTLHNNPAGELQVYRENLALLRQEHPTHRELPNLKFFLFGMGDRLKLIYRNGRLLNALTGNIEEQWQVTQEIIVPSAYLVHLVLADGQIVQIQEDETGVWLLQPNKRPKLIPGTRSRVNLPRFAGKRFGPVLRVLHQEILINVIHGRPVPNFLVYQKPRYRDAASMAMVLRQTNNLMLIHDWIMAIHDPFDRNNNDILDADNPGEVLFLVSLVSDKTHPVVQMVLNSIRQFEKDNYIAGKSDNTEHPVYQTKWFKYGLKSLNLPDRYSIPKQYDSYSSLVWWAYTHDHVEGKKFSEDSGLNYPYLSWAEDHFYAGNRGFIGTLDYPLSWEQHADNAHYPGLTVLDKDLVKQKLAFPQAWHAAEMFLLLEKQ
ncbi:hypothetical protein [Spirosoma pollinicola]|uniref:Uncharacterized protein n=1 Tax=Spirosoma pollinicola TaxID=2057025 RepID=A0A2K8YY52_9BACT|nr:hypothetical protein [Spirosoma pollinicola]AUD02551.1 hypothetical protein CWM47_12340 [Spirosoma pollinicola]